MIPAVVMAAGEGRRLRPLTERWPKPVLPIDGRPVLAVLLRELAVSRVPRATVVVGHLAERVEALAGDGSAFGLELHYVRQPSPDGSADAVLRAGEKPPYVAVAADTVFPGGAIASVVGTFLEAQADGAIAVRREPPPDPPHRPATRVVAGRVERVLDDDAANPLSAAPLWVLGPAVHAELAGLDGPPFQLADAFSRALAGGAEIAGVEIGETRDLTRPADLVQENFAYLSIP